MIDPGARSPVITHRGIKMAAAVCVDLFYPEVIRRLALDGAEIILNPANIPAARTGLWRSLGVARAAENTVYTAMANNTGTRYADGREVAGDSFVAGPDGDFFIGFGTKPGVYVAELNIDLVAKTRRRWRYLEDVR